MWKSMQIGGEVTKGKETGYGREYWERNGQSVPLLKSGIQIVINENLVYNWFMKKPCKNVY